MRVILLEDVENLGRAGDVVEVKDGYARNYLIPRGLVQPATKGALKQIEQIRQAVERRRARERGHAESIAAVLKETVIEFRVRAGSRNRLYGSITTADIAAAIHEKTGIEIDRRSILLERPLRQLGEYIIPLRLAAGVVGEVTVRVLNEHGELPEVTDWEEAETAVAEGTSAQEGEPAVTEETPAEAASSTTEQTQG